MLAAYGRRMRASPGPTRRTLVVSIEALLDARGGKNLRGQGQAHRSPSENARELAVYMYSSLQAVSFREAVRVEAPTQGAGSESGYCILYGLQICQVVIRVHMCAHHSQFEFHLPAQTPHARPRRAVAGSLSLSHAAVRRPHAHGRARRSPHAARTITFQHTRHYTEFYIAPLPLAGRCIASFRGQQVTSPRLV